jgi:hypothetical protein
MNALTPITPAGLVESPPLVIQEGPAALMAAIMQFASNPAMDIDKFDRLIALQERAEDRQERAEDRQAERAFNVAFVRLQARLPRIKRDGSLEYPADKSKSDGPKRAVGKYAKWETIDAGIRPILTEEGFGLSFRIAPRTGDGGGLFVSPVLRHIGGYKDVGDPFPIPLDTSGGKNHAQAYGSTLSYGKKYAAFAALNIVTEGEDTGGRIEPAADVERVNGRMSPAELKILNDLIVQTSTREDKFLSYHKLDFRSVADVPAKEFVRLKNSLLGKIKTLNEREAFAAKTRAAAARAPRDERVVGKMMDAWDDIQRGDRP